MGSPEAATPSRSGRVGLLEGGARQIGRQIQLPWSKAIEISFKSVKVRFWRSLITAAGIVLAIAFLMATLTRNAVVNGLKAGLPGEIRVLRAQLSPAALEALQEKAEAARAAAQQADAADPELQSKPAPGAGQKAAAPVNAEPKTEAPPAAEPKTPAPSPKAPQKAAKQKAEKADKAEAGAKTLTRADLLRKVRDAIRSNDFVPAANLLEKALTDRKDLAQLPQVQALQASLAPVLDTLKRLSALDDVRLALIKQGEPPPQDVGAAALGSGAPAGGESAAAAPAAAPPSESHVRDRWLMVLALLVAFVGITNSMLMSVTERFREIGTMKCLGALDSFVVKLFLIESSMQGFLGTLVGVLLGLLLALAKVAYDYGGTGFSFLPWGQLGLSVFLALGCGTLLAVAGALYPAYVAAKMEPAVAMRVDQ